MNTKDLPFQEVDSGTLYPLALAGAAAAVAYSALPRLRAV